MEALSCRALRLTSQSSRVVAKPASIPALRPAGPCIRNNPPDRRLDPCPRRPVQIRFRPPPAERVSRAWAPAQLRGVCGGRARRRRHGFRVGGGAFGGCGGLGAAGLAPWPENPQARACRHYGQPSARPEAPNCVPRYTPWRKTRLRDITTMKNTPKSCRFPRTNSNSPSSFLATMILRSHPAQGRRDYRGNRPKEESISIGSGNTTVVFFSDPISTSVCR